MNLRLVLINMLLWVAFGLVYLASLSMDALRFQTGFQYSPRMLFLVVIVYACWGIVTATLFSLLNQPVRQGRWSQVGLIYLLGMLIWQPAAAVIDISASHVVLGSASGSFWRDLLNMRFFYVYLHGVLYTTGFIACTGFIYYRHTQQIQLESARLQQAHLEAQRDLADMKMLVLQAQLSPHFLFNCLNAISALARSGATKALIKANAGLAELLRFAVDATERSLISVTEELQFTRQYIALQEIRFGDRYCCRIHCEDLPGASECPPFVLQTLVENAYQHSTDAEANQIPIEIQVTADAQHLIFSVCNPYLAHHATAEEPGLGIALGNLRRRLSMLYPQTLYPQGASLEQSQQGSWYCTRVVIPRLVEDAL